MYFHHPDLAYSPVEIIGGVYDHTATKGEAARLECVADGNPPPQYTWKKDGQVIVLRDRYTLVAGGSLRIERVDIPDEGKYECEAKNNGGVKRSHGYLKVRGKVLYF